MRALLCGLLLGLVASAAAAEEAESRWPVRPSFGAGVMWLYPTQGGDSERVYQFELTLERGGFFAGATALFGLDEVPAQSFLGGKVGYVFTDWFAQPYASVGLGKLTQTAIFAFDEGTAGTSSGPGFLLEAGAVLFRRPGLGRVSVFAVALVPTFDVRLTYTNESKTVRTVGFGLRVAL